MDPIENKEIRGLSVRNMLTIIGCTIGSTLTTLTTYYNLKSDITDVRVSKDSDARLNDLKMRVMDQRIDAVDIQLKDLNKKFEERK